MQYHVNGFRPGDPSLSPASIQTDAKDDTVDVLIVGCGPAGLTLAAQLAQFPDIKTKIVERKDGPLEIGQADGIACRSMEMFQAFGFADKVAKEAYWVNEVSFWRPESTTRVLSRADRIMDVEDGLSEMPHTILSQARVHDFYLEVMRKAPTRLEPDYGLELGSLKRTGDLVTATFESTENSTQTVIASYVVGCDGAHSSVRKAMGLDLKGQSARQLWGVMDVLLVTDFPDIRLKCAIQSLEHGSLLIIPREGGHMVRMYIELDKLEGDERAKDRGLNSDALVARAKSIFSPYSIDIKEVAWWSAYEIGQRVCDVFDDTSEANTEPRIFIAGDACHTHSPKAGQGMNVSMADTFNLGWKLASVIRKQAGPKLLCTYSHERQAKAKELIDFDRDMARLFSNTPKNATESAEFQRYFKQHGRYTAGVETLYDPSLITSAENDQHLAKGYPVGMRFHSHSVVRLSDAKPVELGHVLKADGRWRLIIFAGSEDTGLPDGKISNLCSYLGHNPTSPVRRYTDSDADIDSLIDVRAVFQQNHRSLTLETMPELLTPQKGRLGLLDYEKIYCPSDRSSPDIFDARQIDRAKGAMILIRPDQFVACVLSINNTEVLEAFFTGWCRQKS